MAFWDMFTGGPQIQVSNKAQVAPTGPQGDFLPTIGAGAANYGAATAGQMDLATALKLASEGKGPSPVAAQLQQGIDAGTAATASNIASARGLTPAAAARLASGAQETGNLEAANLAAQAKAREQQAAQGALAGVLGNVAGQGVAAMGTAAGANTSQNQLNANNFNAAQNLNTQIGIQQAGIQQNADTQSAGMIMNAAQAGLGAAGMGSPMGRLPTGAAGPGGSTYNGQGFKLGDTFAGGGLVPGSARKPGDHPDNDTVPILASPKEIVLPRSVTMADDAPERAMRYVQAIKDHEAHINHLSAGGPLEYSADDISRASKFVSRLGQKPTPEGYDEGGAVTPWHDPKITDYDAQMNLYHTGVLGGTPAQPLNPMEQAVRLQMMESRAKALGSGAMERAVLAGGTPGQRQGEVGVSAPRPGSRPTTTPASAPRARDLNPNIQRYVRGMSSGGEVGGGGGNPNHDEHGRFSSGSGGGSSGANDKPAKKMSAKEIRAADDLRAKKEVAARDQEERKHLSVPESPAKYASEHQKIITESMHEAIGSQAGFKTGPIHSRGSLTGFQVTSPAGETHSRYIGSHGTMYINKGK